MRVRPFASEDADPTRAILDANYKDRWVRSLHEGSHGLPIDHPTFQRSSLVAERDGVVVGAGTISRGERHPRRGWVAIDVAPPDRRRGVGTALLAELRGFTERPLCARAHFEDQAGVHFLRGHGFGLLDRSWGGRFDPAAVLERLPEPTLGRPPTLDEAAAFFERWYCETHQFDAPTPWPLERAREFFCGDELIAGSLVGVRGDAGDLIAAGNLIRTPGYDSGDELYLVWAGTLRTERRAATTIVAVCAQFAREAGKAIRFEVNEANEAIRTALEQLDVLGEPELGIFAEDSAV